MVEILRGGDALPPETTEPEMERWLRGTIALNLLTNPSGFGGVRLEVDEVTQKESARALRMLLATSRQDPRYEENDWPLDLAPSEITDRLEDAYRATREYKDRGYPGSDLERYCTPMPHEEAGRPEPHAQVVSAAVARERSERIGGVHHPMVYGVPPHERVRVAHALWLNGIPSIPANGLGITLSPAPGDRRVHWDATHYPYGILCGVELRPREILNVGNPETQADDEKLDEITKRANRLALCKQEYPEVLRNLLIEEGYLALRRHLRGGALVVLDPHRINIIRETIPPFMKDDEPLRFPPATSMRPLRRPAEATLLTSPAPMVSFPGTPGSPPRNQ